jgi:hypothetical protein
MMPVVELVYSSVARPGLTSAELRSVLRTARAHNGGTGITGMLFHGNGAFMQALEGSRSAVNALYNHIVQDPRHSQCEVLHYRENTARRFAEWSMRLESLEPDSGRERLRRALLLDISGSEKFEPQRMSGAKATTFLHELAHLECRLDAEPIAPGPPRGLRPR